MTTQAADEELDQAHRLWFGRLVGWLFRMTGDLELSEDAVGGAFAAAVSAWRASGIPDAPEAWLRVVARNQAMSSLRRKTRTLSVAPEAFEALEGPSGPLQTLDDRLSLMFVCAHPAIDARMHAPLMLQAVLGVDAARISSVFLVPPSTMGQRLSRAKTKIRDAGIRFRMPETDEFAGRLGAVLQAVYAAYGLADPIAGVADARDESLRAEALRLAELLTEVLPAEAETWGLYALLLHTESRRSARVVNGEFIPLSAQDTRLWSSELRSRADECLRKADRLSHVGRFQLEAAISAVHSSRADLGQTDWGAITVLYRGLLNTAPSVGAALGAASALIETGAMTDAAALLDALPEDAVRKHQPYWVCRARLADARGDLPAAVAASDIAIGLTADPAVRAFLIRTRPR
jgi:RNA polymerase sigma-70 factor (ECF subfamily)